MHFYVSRDNKNSLCIPASLNKMNLIKNVVVRYHTVILITSVNLYLTDHAIGTEYPENLECLYN